MFESRMSCRWFDSTRFDSMAASKHTSYSKFMITWRPMLGCLRQLHVVVVVDVVVVAVVAICPVIVSASTAACFLLFLFHFPLQVARNRMKRKKKSCFNFSNFCIFGFSFLSFRRQIEFQLEFVTIWPQWSKITAGVKISRKWCHSGQFCNYSE